MTGVQRNDISVRQTEPARIQNGKLAGGITIDVTYYNNSGDVTTDTDAHVRILTADGVDVASTVIENHGGGVGDPADIPAATAMISQKGTRTFHLRATFKDDVPLSVGAEYRLAVQVADQDTVIPLRTEG